MKAENTDIPSLLFALQDQAYADFQIYRPYDSCPYLVMALMKNDAEAQTLFDSLKVKHHSEIEEENRIAIDAIRDYFNFSEPISIEKIETEVVASKTVKQRLLPDAKVLVVIDIDNTQWDRFDQMNCVYIGMETVNKAFEYYLLPQNAEQ